MDKRGERRQLLGSNAEGTHFFVTFMQNEIRTCGIASYPQFRLSFASRFATTVTMTLPGGQVINYTLKPFQVQSYIDNDPTLECVGERVMHRAIELRSDKPISVYSYSSKLQTSDGYLALPVDSWGTEYVTANYPLDYYQFDPQSPCSDEPRGGEFAILAAEDNTQVNVYPATLTLGNNRAMFTRTLMRGDVLEVQDGGTLRGKSDITGSQIVANKPVGVLSGHVRAGIPIVQESKNHLVEMIPPRNELGKVYAVVPFGGRLGGDIVRVVSSDPSPTSITFTTSTNSVTQVLATLGSFAEFDLQDVSMITADRPVLVAQYSKSQLADPRNTSRKVVASFDPYMVVITPQEQFVNGAIFQTMPDIDELYQNHQQYTTHYITLISERKGFETIMLDGAPLTGQPEFASGIIPNTNLMWASMRVGQGSAHVLAGDALFGGYVYGLGAFDAYGWPIGSGLRKFDVPDTKAPVLEAIKDCGGYNITASESGPFESGLLNAWFDSTWSQNVNFQRTMLIKGDELTIGRVALADPLLPGRARFIAEDLAHNIDTIVVDLQPAMPPAFGEREVLLSGVQVNQTYFRSFFVKNPNPAPLVIDSVACIRRKEFLLDGIYTSAVSIPPGDSLEVKVLFATIVKKPAYDTMVVKSNCQTYRVPMRALISFPMIATADREYDSLRVGKTRCLDVHVRSTGGDTLRLDSAVLDGAGFAMPIPLKGPILLPPNADTTVSICFTPTQIGGFNGTVRFFSDADSGVTAAVHGVGIYPRLSIGGYDFGRRQVGDTLCTTVPLTNIGEDTAHVTGVTLSDPAAFLPDPTFFPRLIPAGDTVWLPVCFAPLDEQSYSSDVLLENKDGLEASNNLLGSGYMLRAMIDGCDWKERWVGTTHDSVVYLRNRGASPIRIDSIWIGEGDIGDFNVDPLPGPTTIPVGDSIPVMISFRPLLPGLRSCMIYGGTASRQEPIIDSVLQGFGLVAMASDRLEFDSSLAYSCAARTVRLTIFNDGNTPLTVSDIRFRTSLGFDSSSASGFGQLINIGDSLVMDFPVDFLGHTGTMTGDISWSFVELPDTIHRRFSMESRGQEYSILAGVPPTIGLGKKFDLTVRIDTMFWANLPQESIALRLEYNPTIARFDSAAFVGRSDTARSSWRPFGRPVLEKPGMVKMEFRPGNGDPWQVAPLPLDSVIFMSFPFQSFLGNNRQDTIRITMTAIDGPCTPSCSVMAPYKLDSVCGLNYRLFEYTGSAYALKQNTPNPSNGKTEIEFTLGMDAPTTLELFSNNGQLVRVLVDGTLTAGDYAVPIDLHQFPSGLYYYRLSSGPFGAIRQMVITK
ncbi:MAG: T9SS type A sorting domain-containing protein [Candidatus Kapaibacterium sp.]